MNEEPKPEGQKKNSKLLDSFKQTAHVPLWALLAILGFAMSAMRALTLRQADLGTLDDDWRLWVGISLAFFAWPMWVRYVQWAKKKAKPKMDEQAVSPVIGVILMVAITVVLAAGVFFAVSKLAAKGAEAPPTVNFTAAGAGSYELIQAPSGLDWSAFFVQGCSGVPTGSFDAGDQITGCTGRVSVGYRPSNSIVWTNGA